MLKQALTVLEILLLLKMKIRIGILNQSSLWLLSVDNIKGKAIQPKDFTYLSSHSLINKAISEYGYSDHEEKTRIIYEQNQDNDFIIKADENLFIYIIFNLLKNSFYYKNVKPNLNITIEKKLSHNVYSNNNKNIIKKQNIYYQNQYNQVIIEDNGIGISSDIIPNLFGDFITSGKNDGTGLGLAFCKRAMKALGGDIICESELNKYTRFILLFPKLSKEEMEKYQIKENYKKKAIKNKESLTIETLKNKNILIVDDMAVNLIILKSHLKQYHINIEAKNGKEMYNKYTESIIKNNKYDLIIADINMGGQENDGDKSAKKIREFEKINKDKITKPIPIIAYSTDNQEEIQGFLDSGMNDNFTKGENIEKLAKKMALLISSK